MKSLKTIIILLLIIIFSSCSSDNNKSEYTFSGNYTSINTIKSDNIYAPPIIIQGDNLSIDSMFAKYKYTEPIIYGDLNYSKSHIAIAGLDSINVTLKSFTVIINGYEKLFGDVSKDEDIMPNQEMLNYMNEVLKIIINQKKLNVQVKFNSNPVITEKDSIRLIINFEGKFKYLQ